MFGRYLSASINATLASIYRPWLLRTLPRLPSAAKREKKLFFINKRFYHFKRTWRHGDRNNEKEESVKTD